MLRSFARILKFTFYAALIIIGVTFAVSNRAKVDLTLFPLPYEITMPVFLFTIVVFIIGVLIGWGLAGIQLFKNSRSHKAAKTRAAAVENELAALRSEQQISIN